MGWLGSRPNRPAMLGMNLAFFVYYSRQQAAQNLWHAIGDWRSIQGGVWDAGDPITVDADGYPTNVDATHVAAGIIEHGESIPEGTSFTITWSGPGSAITVDGGSSGGANVYTWVRGAPASENMTLRIAANGVSNMVIRRTSESITGKFRAPFLARCRRYSVLRFMDWARTNIGTAKTWATRSTENGRQALQDKGVSHEWQVDLLNETGCGGWFNLHHTVDDEYVENWCDLVMDRRGSNKWPIYVEYTNEPWNNIFPQKAYLEPTLSDAFFDAYLLRTKQIATILRSRGMQPTIVINMQAINTSFASWYLIQSSSPKNLDGIDAISIAPYFYQTSANSSITSASQALTECDTFMNTTLAPKLAEWKTICATRKKRLLAYEAGQHLQSSTDPVATYYREANRHADMGPLITKNLRLWRDIAGGDLFCYFNDMQVDTHVSGTWGAMSHELHTVGPNTNEAVKQYAIQQFMAEMKQ